MAKRRRVRMDRFKAQVAEHVISPDNLIELEIGEDVFVTIKLPILLAEGDDYVKKIEEAQHEGGEAIALVILGESADRTAEEQLELWLDAGNTIEDLATVFTAETADARDRLGKFRFNG